jgi:hypothetical protein
MAYTSYYIQNRYYSAQEIKDFVTQFIMNQFDKKLTYASSTNSKVITKVYYSDGTYSEDTDYLYNNPSNKKSLSKSIKAVVNAYMEEKFDDYEVDYYPGNAFVKLINELYNPTSTTYKDTVENAIYHVDHFIDHAYDNVIAPTNNDAGWFFGEVAVLDINNTPATLYPSEVYTTTTYVY